MTKPRRVSPYNQKILDNLPIKVLDGLVEILNKKNAYESLFYLIGVIREIEKNTIVSESVTVKSMDKMIEKTKNDAFSRGRISSCEIIGGIFQQVGDYRDKRLEGKVAKKKNK